MIYSKNILKTYVVKSLSLIFLSFLIILLFAYLFLKSFFLNQEKQKIISLVDKIISANVYQESEFLLLSKVNNIRITVISPQGLVTFDSEKPFRELENHLEHEEVQLAIKFNRGMALRKNSSTAKNYIYYAVKTNRGDILRIAKEREEIESGLKNYLKEILIAFIIIYILVFSMFYSVLRKKINQIDSIFNSIISISKGEIFSPVLISKKDILYPLKESIDMLELNLDQLKSELKKRTELLEVVFQNLPFPSALFGNMGQILIYNEPFHKIFSQIKDIFQLNQLLRITIDFKQIEHRAEFDVERDGRFYKIILTPIKTVQYSYHLISLMDITEIKNLEKVKSEFVSNISHELKTPITVLRGFTETLETEIADDKKFMVHALRKHITRLEYLVKDILTLSQLEDNKNIVIEKVSLKETVEQSISLFEKQAQSKDIKIIKNIPGDIIIDGDGFLIIQALTNLLSNAIKFTENNGTIVVKLYKDEHKAYINIEDSGVGIPYHLRDKIFDRFFVVDKSRSRELGGTGLGLSIVKQIMETHKGSIEYLENTPKGSVFKLSFPL